MGWSIDVSVVTTHKYAVKESGDIVEIVDLPDGGVGLIVADGQGSGSAARSLARSAASQAWQLLQQGVRAESVASAVSDALFHGKSGKVSVSLDVVCFDRHGTADFARLSTNSLAFWAGDRWQVSGVAAEPGGRYDRQAPDLRSFGPISPAAFLIVTDGVSGSGNRFENSHTYLEGIPDLSGEITAADLAERVFNAALGRDNGRPGDDMTVVACLLSKAQIDQRIERRSLHKDVR